MATMVRTARLRAALTAFALVLLALVAFPFAQHSATLGWQGLTRDLSGESRFFLPDGRLSNPAVFGHMVAGGMLTGLVPIQLIPSIRRRAPSLHRASGYLLAASAGVAGVGGLVYIALRGTVGGPLMSMAFGLYGALILLAAAQTLRFARARAFGRHKRWALRLAVLAMGSWLYRVHYGLWYVATGGTASNDAFTGLFDQVALFTFYLPYLAILEAILRISDARGRAGRSPD